MNNGRTCKKIPGISYCKCCKTFYVNFCYCVQNSPTTGNGEASLTSHNNGLTLMTKFLYVIFIIYNNGNKLLKFKDHYSQNFSALQKKNDQDFKNIYQNYPFSKYINLCTYRRNNIAPNRNFYVCMMTVHSEDENVVSEQESSNKQSSLENTPRNGVSETTSASTCSLASKKSTTGSVLSRISKSLKRKKKSLETPNVDELFSPKLSTDGHETESSTLPSPSLQSIHSKSKIPILKSKQNVQKEYKAIPSPKTSIQTRSFFRKLVPKQPKIEETLNNYTTSDETLKKTSEEAFLPEIKEQLSSGIGSEPQQNRFGTKSFQQVDNMEEFYCRGSSSHVYNQVHLNYLSSNLKSNLNLHEGLQEVVNISHRLQESEAHLTHVISKYILDHNFEKDLLNVLTNHAKLHIEAERRTQNLAHEMWLQQSDMMKAQEIALQDNLSSIVKQNRKLQDEMENLVRYNEKLRIANERQFSNYLRQPLDTNNHLIENLSKNNDTLRYKASNMAAQLEEQEKEFQVLQRKSQLLEQQLRNSNSHVQNYKLILQRVQTDNELEHAHLSHQLQVNQMTVKESAEAGDVLLEDMDALKRQIKSMPCTLNWTKFKNRGSNLPDLIYMCRSCINELAKELLKSNTETILKDKDINSLKDEIKRIEETLESSKSEQKRLQNQLKTSEVHEIELKKYMAKCSNLERELGEYKQQVEKVSNEFEKEKISFIASVDDIESLNKKIIEKEEELILTNDKMYEYKSENDALRMQIHGLKQVLSVSGAGDVARELTDTKEKMTFFQSQYYQLVSEKNYLIEQLQTANLERGTLSQYQNNYYQFIQTQQQDLEMLHRDNLILRQELEAERNEAFALKTEMAILEEEKNVMRHIYTQLKNEISKVQKLQGEVTGINYEANRLALIAEYNKQLGEKLQCEVAEKNVKISELQTSLQKLNNAQMENSKDKVALCVELTEVCTLNNQLNSSLVAEHQKSTHLDESKKKFENSANTQLKVVEQMQKAERAALRELLKDFKNVVTQRDNLLSSQNEYLQQISDLRDNALFQARSVEEINEKSLQALEQIEKFKDKLKESEKELEKLHGVIDEKQNANSRLEEELSQLKNQKDALDLSKTYLQNTAQKLHNDLNESRKNELDAKQALKNELKKLELLEQTLNRTKDALTKTSQENQLMVQEVASFNEAYKKLLMDYEANVSKANATQEELRKNLVDTQVLVGKGFKETERLEKVVAEKDLEIVELQQHSSNLIQQIKQMEVSMEDIDAQSKMLSESNLALVQLQDALASLELEHEECTRAIAVLTQEKQKLQSELKSHVDNMEANYSHYKSYIEGTIREHSDQKEQMEADLRTLSEQLQDLKDSCETEKKSHSKLLEAHKDLAGKLLKAVRMLIDEKVNKQNVEANVAKLYNETQQLLLEKEAAEKTTNQLSNQLEELRSRVGCLLVDKKTLQDILSDLQELYKRSQSRCRLTEQKLQDVKRKKRNPSATSSKILSLKETRSKLQSTEERAKKFKNDLDKSHKTIMDLKIEISSLKQQLTVMEFQKCETALRLHETEGKLRTEQSMNTEFIELNQQIVKEVIQMKREGIITLPASDALLWIVQGQRPSNSNNITN